MVNQMIDSALKATKKFNKLMEVVDARVMADIGDYIDSLTEDESKLVLRKIVYGGWRELEKLAGSELSENDKFEGYERQKIIFEELEKTRKQKEEESYRSIKEVAKMMKISPVDYCDYRDCRKKADEKVIASAKIIQETLQQLVDW
jgi:hypothetical protein